MVFMHRSARVRTLATALFLVTAVASSAFAAAVDNSVERPKEPASSSGPQEPPPQGFASWQSLFSEQHRLNSAADRINAEGKAGFSGIVADPSNRELRLFWKGEVPAAVRSAISEATKIAPVKVISAPYANQQLLAEAKRWADSGLVTSAAPKPDGSGVVIGVSATEHADPVRLPGGSAVPVTVEHNSSPAAVYSRQSDLSPFYGGGRYKNVRTGAGCTTGFAIKDVNGIPGFLTAGHCGDSVKKDLLETGGGLPLGVFESALPKRDLAVIHSSSTSRVFSGLPSSDSSLPVVNTFSNYSGNYVCTSGAFSGEHCGVKLDLIDITVSLDNGQNVFPEIRGIATNGGCAVAPGDSGGPVYTYYYHGGSFSNVLAQGVISAGNGILTPCGLEGAGAFGWPAVFFVDAQKALSFFKATLQKQY
ncbi:S1 family peptidase [Streptomyces sp. NPDC005500]|uniref:S1 family peptidase n=1 Tax=Streptomyces sp. NPDC005500 TaxID=3155007 RepID=UPI0033B9180F